MQQKSFEFKKMHIAYFEANTRNTKKILLMHGYSFESSVWERFGFIDFLGGIGYASFAIDIPGFPNSRNKDKMPEAEFFELISSFIQEVVKVKPALLGASASGYLALKFAEEHSREISAVIAVGPVNLDSIEFAKISVPILGVWGSEDRIAYPNAGADKLRNLGAKAEIIKGAGHACYLDKPEEFKKIVSSFLSSITGN